MSMGHREVLKSFDERNVFSGWRKFIARYQRAGETKKVKRMFNRRIRRNLHQHINEDTVE